MSKSTGIVFKCDFCEDPGLFNLRIGKFACPKHSKTRQQIFDEANEMMNTGSPLRGFGRKDEESEEDEEEIPKKNKEKEELKEGQKRCCRCGKGVYNFKELGELQDKGIICFTCSKYED